MCHLRRLVFDQSSPVHPVSESRGVAWAWQTDGRTNEGRKSSCQILNASDSCILLTFIIIIAYFNAGQEADWVKVFSAFFSYSPVVFTVNFNTKRNYEIRRKAKIFKFVLHPMPARVTLVLLLFFIFSFLPLPSSSINLNLYICI